MSSQYNFNIILASGSPRRRELLALAEYDFEVVPSLADENIEIAEPDEYVKRLASMKAHEVCSRIADSIKEDVIVLGADTVVSYDGRILGKPKDRDDARNMLRMLSGQTHQVHTGVCLLRASGGKDANVQISRDIKDGTDSPTVTISAEKIFAEQTDVTFYDITDDELEAYLDTDESYDKAGGYGIQGKGGLFVRSISGDYNNVVGLPLARVYHEIKRITQI